MEAFDPTGRVRLVGMPRWVSCDDQQMPPKAPIWLIRSAAVFGLVGGALIVMSAVAVMFGVYEQIFTPGLVAAILVFAWKVTLAVWLIVKGFRPVSILTAPAGRPAVTAAAR